MSNAARWNEKYSEFFVTRWSSKTGRFVMVGKSHKTFEDAMAASRRYDAKHGILSSAVDVVRPRAA